MSVYCLRWESQSYEDWMNDMATCEAPRFSGNARQRRKWLRAYNYGHAVKGELLSGAKAKRASDRMRIERD